MGAFTPFKRNANRFNYVPRYYDPAKEEREQRREELLGRRRDSENEEYIPGDYIRTQREARNARRAASGRPTSKSPFRVWIMLAVVVALLIMGSSLFNSLTKMMDGTAPTTTQSSAPVEKEFNPEATIIIVPNDYVEE